MEKIKIAIDTCIVIILSKLASENLNDKDKALIDCLRRQVLTPDLYENVPDKHVPSLLKDKYLGRIKVGDNGKKYYTNLSNMYALLTMVKSGRCELYITPTVFGELDFEWFQETRNFIDKYVNVIKVMNEDASAFYAKRGHLAKEYVRSGAMLEEFSAPQRTKVPQNDAYIMAEASICGLVLVTVNDKDFINSNIWKEDYKRVLAIEEINTRNKLEFNSNIKNYKIPPQPMSLHSFIMKSRYRKNTFIKPYYITNPNIDDDNTYKLM